jgi:hypothetical protein
LLDGPQAASRGYFDEAVVSGLLRSHMASTDERGALRWNLAMLELWHQTWIDGEAVVT